MMKDFTPRHVVARELKAWIHDPAELALLDVREHGQFGENHLFFAVPLPYSELELHIARLVPRPRTSRSEEHTSELPVTNAHLVCRLLLAKKKINQNLK